MNILRKMFGSYSKKELKRVEPITQKVLALEEKYTNMSEEELKNQTTVLKERLANGETTDDILPEAFATCREASWRVLGMKHFPVQITGGIILHQGRIAEMKTGEGKTLVATLPAYLNALTGEGVHIVTVNDYLATRDSEWMGKVYKYLGLTVWTTIQEKKCMVVTLHMVQTISLALTIFVTIWLFTKKIRFSVAMHLQSWMKLTQSLLMKPELHLLFQVKVTSQLTYTQEQISLLRL